MAFFLALLLVVGTSGFIWEASIWFTDTVLAYQYDDPDILALMPFVIFVLLCAIALYSSRMGLSSSIALFVIFLLSKAPMF